VSQPDNTFLKLQSLLNNTWTTSDIKYWRLNMLYFKLLLLVSLDYIIVALVMGVFLALVNKEQNSSININLITELFERNINMIELT